MFNKVSIRKPKRSKFDLGHMRVASMKMGYIYPIMIKPVLPTERVAHTSDIMARAAPMLSPVWDDINIKLETFYVPTRLVWTQEESEAFFTGGPDGTAAPVHPKIRFTNTNKAFTAKGTLSDFIGLPDMSAVDWGAATLDINALPYRAILLIYNEYYRNQNMIDPIPFSKASGVVTDATQIQDLTSIRKCMWNKDYFTSALHDTQRGDQVLIPMEAEVTYKPISDVFTSAGTVGDGALSATDPGDNPGLAIGVPSSSRGRIENIDSISNSTITIIDLRRAERLQEFLEKLNVAGGRYKEYLRAIFGGFSSDGRLQRPEMIGGARFRMQVSEVPSTFTDDTEGTTPQGYLAGHGVGIGRSKRVNRKFEEHGILVTLMRILPNSAYIGQGIPRWLTYSDRFDYPTPDFAQVGEQPIYTRELYAQVDNFPADFNEVFGYGSRYSEAKYIPNTAHGDMKDTLEYQHMFRKFDIKPTLGETFVSADPTNRIFSVVDQDVDNYYVKVYNHTSAVLPLPYFGTPTL